MKKTILFLILLGSSFAFCQAQISYTQTDWSGGSGQETFTDVTKFYIDNNVDFSTLPGDIELIENNNNSFYGIVEFQDKIMIGSAAGTFIYDPLNNSWEHSVSGSLLLYHTTIHENLLYTLYGNNIYNYDGTENDYGLGPNGWNHFSDLTPLGTTSTFSIESIDGDLLVGARRGYNGCVLKWNSTSEEWEDMGSSFSNGVTSLSEYDGELYAGTHWSGTIYKWNGSNWLTAYDTPLMTVTSLVIKDGILYAGGYDTQSNTGNIYSYDGSDWTMVYDGYGIQKMIIHGDNIAFSTRRSTESSANNLSGQIYQYDGSAITLIHTLPTESYAFDLLSYNGNLYYGGVGNSTFGGVATSDFYKNGTVLEKVYGGYLYSSDIVNSTGAWGGYIEYDITDSERSGVSVTLREKRSDDSYGPVIQFPENTIIDLSENTIQYIIYFWGLKDADLPSMQEIQLQTSDYLPAAELENPKYFSLYPNPSNGKVQIQIQANLTTTYSLRIYNYLGKMVYNEDRLNDEITYLDLSNLVKGIYLVELKNKNQRTIQKLEIY